MKTLFLPFSFLLLVTTSDKVLPPMHSLATNTNNPTTPRLNPLPSVKHSFIVIAHRADHVTAPENSLAAIDSAIKHEVDYVELDLRTSSDHLLYIMHDATINRTSSGKGELSKLTGGELDTCHLKQSLESIPKFETCLQHCRGKINIYLDFKNADVSTTYALLKKYDFAKSVIVYINTPNQYVEWRKWAPDIPLIISMPGNITSGQELKDFLSKYPAEVLDGNYKEYTPEMVKTANSLGVAVWPDIQSPAEMNNWPEAIRTGFGGLQTDHPQQLIAWLTQAKIR